MRFFNRVGMTLLLLLSVVSAQPSPQDKTVSARELEIAPGVRLVLPRSFTTVPVSMDGLQELRAQLPRKQSGLIQVTTEKRRSEAEAVNRLSQVAQETAGKRTFLDICGWPAMERQYQARLGLVGDRVTKKPMPEAPLVQAVTIAIAQADLLIRFEARLQPGATVEATAPIFALVRTISCPANSNSEPTQHQIENLQAELLRSGPIADLPVGSPLPKGTLADRILPRPVAGVETSTGPNWSEIQITASADGKNVVVASNGMTFSANQGVSFSTDYGNSFRASQLDQELFSDPTLATGASGQFYLGAVNLTSAGCADQVDINRLKNGAFFSFAGNAALCPPSGFTCLPDQPQMAADTKNSAPTGDQLYMVWRQFSGIGFGSIACVDLALGFVNPAISCSSDNAATWGHRTAIGSGDVGRVTVGPDGFVYVTFVQNSNLMIHKFSSCTNGLTPQPGFPVLITPYSGVDCPISGIEPDRCNSAITSSPQPAVSMDFPRSVFVAYADKTGNGNDNIVVRHSRDGGLTWPDTTIANSVPTGHRFMPWVCAGSNNANVSWYDRRAANAIDDSLTNYFFNSTSGTAAGVDVNVSITPDSQKLAKPPCMGCEPKFGDYNGNTCTRDRVYVAWASATPPPGVSAPGGINVFVEAIPPGPPIVTSLTPERTQCGSAGTVTIAGANFRGVSKVQLETQFLSVPAASFTVSSPSLMTATLPSTVPGGVYELVVYTPTGSSTQRTAFPPYRTDLLSVAPMVSGVSPTDGSIAGGTQVTVSGSCFAPNSRFFFGNAEASVSQCSTMQCSVYSPASTFASSVDVIANTAGVASSTASADLFTYDGPQITSVTPASGPITGGTYVTVSGSGFPQFDGLMFSLNPVMTLFFGAARTVPQCEFTWCTLLTPPALNPGDVDVVATAFGAASAPSPGAVFTYTAKPKLVRFETPITYSGVQAIVGLDGNAPADGASVTLSSDNPSLVTVAATATIAPTQLSAITPVSLNPSPTNQNVTLTASYDGTSLTSSVTVPASPPLTISINATALTVGQTADVTVGINVPAPPPGAVVTLSSSAPATIAVPSSGTVTILPGQYSTKFSITNQYAGGPNQVTISGSYNGASASDSVAVFVPPPKCVVQQCKRFYYWNPDDCRCEAGLPIGH